MVYFSMFQACVSISACIFYVFYECTCIHRVCVYKMGILPGKEKLPTYMYLPYFSVALMPTQAFFFWPNTPFHAEPGVQVPPSEAL